MLDWPQYTFSQIKQIDISQNDEIVDHITIDLNKIKKNILKNGRTTFIQIKVGHRQATTPWQKFGEKNGLMFL